ncbi:GNAT family N-acetyltransferase [Micromonospora endolithica]|uniref:GNAT family N-acetyltransferase n=1 Tax=Micromonospora endolithica TaxID=230091 RepID=UPI001EE0ED5F|nr:GNAT family N-acetyltransferase [Micromonospora endolithica]
MDDVEPGGPGGLAATLRALRRRADLSQRELAERAGVPQATLARIEAGRTGDPRYRTVESLVRAAGGRVSVSVSVPRPPADAATADAASADVVTADVVTADAASAGDALSAVPHDELRDAAGRRYPAHLDVWEVREPRDWPGAWWAAWYNLPEALWPLRPPAASYHRNRDYRDQRRWGEEVRRTVRVRRVTGAGLPATSWRFVAELPDGELVGELRAHERSPHLRHGDPPSGERELVLDGVLVADRYRQLGIGRRLVLRATDEMARVGIRTAHAIAEGPAVGLLRSCGFALRASRPWSMRLDRTDREGGNRARSVPGGGDRR